MTDQISAAELQPNQVLISIQRADGSPDWNAPEGQVTVDAIRQTGLGVRVIQYHSVDNRPGAVTVTSEDMLTVESESDSQEEER